MFRLQDNVPNIYVDNSRDFQLFCRLYDCINNGVKSDIDTVINLNVPFKANEKVLNLLALKVGFITDKYIEASLLRWIIATFPWALKFKGSIYGIKLAINTIAKYENIKQTPVVQVDSLQKIVTINTYQLFKNKVALEEYLKYIMPTGYSYEISLIVGEHNNITITNTNELLYFSVVPASIGLDLSDDEGYKNYALFKIHVDVSKINISSITTKEPVTTTLGDFIGVGSILMSSPITHVNETLEYGSDNFPSSVPAGSILVNSRVGGVDYPTFHVSENTSISNEYKSDSDSIEKLGVDRDAIKTTISYYMTDESSYDEEEDSDGNAKPSYQLIYEYVVPLNDINKYKHTILTTQVSGLGDECVYIIYSSGVTLDSVDSSKYTHIYNIVTNSWYKFNSATHTWEQIDYIKEINYTNNK